MAKQKSSNSGSGGKLLDTWYYEFPALEDSESEEASRPRVAGKKVAIELRLIKQFESSDRPPLAVREVSFTLDCKEADIKMEGTDIEALRVALWDKLDEKYETKWEEYFLVELAPEAPFDGIGTGMIFSYRDVTKGTAWDGTLLMKEYRYRHRSGDNEHISPWPGEFKNKNGRILACIPATKANRKALHEFQKRIDALREHLAQYLEPETIVKTLANLTTLSLLPPADPEEEAAEF